MSKNYFTHAELSISDIIPTVDIRAKLDVHIAQMNPVREALGCPITASEESGYRPEWWEKKKGRSGTSQHCFKGKGAIDWTTRQDKLQEMIKLIIEMTDYTRIAYYPTKGFVHCDYKATDGKRYYFESDGASNWTFKKFV